MSKLEDRLLIQILAARLPEPEREVRLFPPRRWRWDFVWWDLRVALDVQGGTWVYGGHSRPAEYSNDCEKLAHASIAGWTVVAVTADMIRDGRALTLIEKAIRVRQED